MSGLIATLRQPLSDRASGEEEPERHILSPFISSSSFFPELNCVARKQLGHNASFESETICRFL